MEEYKGTKGKTPVIAIDFDGVIHRYQEGWLGTEPTDIPMPGVESALKKLKAEGWEIVIMSSRDKKFIEPWLKKYNLDQYFDSIHNDKIPATIYVDDRGFRFESWEQTIEIIEIVKNLN